MKKPMNFDSNERTCLASVTVHILPTQSIVWKPAWKLEHNPFLLIKVMQPLGFYIRAGKATPQWHRIGMLQTVKSAILTWR